MECDHWDTIKDDETNTEYDINIWLDEFYNDVNSFQLCVYELVENHDKTALTIGDSLESYDVVSVNEKGRILNGEELEIAMFGDSWKVEEEVIEDNIKQDKNLLEIINPKIDKVLDLEDMDTLFKQILESEYEKRKFLSIVKNKLEDLISKTPTSDLRNDLTEINVLLNIF
jgi:hypothetical protein